MTSRQFPSSDQKTAGQDFIRSLTVCALIEGAHSSQKGIQIPSFRPVLLCCESLDKSKSSRQLFTNF